MIPSALDAARRYTWWSLVAGVGFCSAFPLVTLSTWGDAGAPVAAMGPALSFGLLLALVRCWQTTPPRWLAATTWSTTTGVWAWAAWQGWDPVWVLPAAACLGLLAMYSRCRRVRVVAGGAVALGLVTAAAGGTGAGAAYVGDALPAVLALAGGVAGLTIVTDWLWQLFVQLDAARRDAGELAVARERLRFAADLHDIQGHTLTVITMKSELARRVLGRDPAAAGLQMAAVEALARQAVTDTRDLVAGYRDVTFATELANAAEVLRAAGISCTYSRVPPLREPMASLFGLVVREATTNILRHSHATAASVEVAPNGTRLVIRNDGAAPARNAAGSGLTGLDERFRAAGGTVRATNGSGMFQVVAKIGSET